MPNLTRRAVLRLGAGAAGAAAASAVAGGAPASADPTMVTGSFVSAARGGLPTNWAIARPPG